MIGIIGGYGDIGSKVTSILKMFYYGEIKIGGRKYQEIVQNCASVKEDGVFKQFVDLKNFDSIRHFVVGCEVIVNCSGCEQIYSGTLAEICYDNNCHFVDVNRNDWLLKNSFIVKGRCHIHNAGSMPGISEMMPGYLSLYFNKIMDIEFYYLAQGEFSYNAARDYVEGLCGGQVKGMMKYKEGKCVPAIEDATRIYIPIFNKEFKIYPYIDNTVLKCVKKLGCINGIWNMAYEEGYTLNIFEKINCTQFEQTDGLVQKICSSSKLDSKIRGRYAGVIVQMRGEIQDILTEKTLLIKYDSPALFTGSAIATTVISILEGKTEHGAYMLSDFTDTAGLIDILRKIKTYSTFIVQSGKMNSILREIEGEI